MHWIPRRTLFESPSSQDIAYGLTMQRIGDVDGDTLDDFVLAAPPIATGQGYLEVRSCLDGALLNRFEPSTPSQAAVFARAVTAVGDLDGDLCSDLVIGQPRLSHTMPGSIEARSGRTGAVLWHIDGDRPSFGVALASMGDLDGDGKAEVVVGVPPMSLQEGGHAEIRSGNDGHEHRAAKTGELAEVEVLEHQETPGRRDREKDARHGARAGEGLGEAHGARGIRQREIGRAHV